MAKARFIYLGIRGTVLALNPLTGVPVWERKLKGAEFVNVVLDGNNLLAATRGEVFCLDPESGHIRWHNPLKGYGWGLVSIATANAPTNPLLAAEKQRQDEEAAAAASSTTAARASSRTS